VHLLGGAGNQSGRQTGGWSNGIESFLFDLFPAKGFAPLDSVLRANVTCPVNCTYRVGFDLGGQSAVFGGNGTGFPLEGRIGSVVFTTPGSYLGNFSYNYTYPTANYTATGGGSFGLEVQVDPAATPWNWSSPALGNGSAPPTPRMLYSMVYDPSDGYVVLFGGGDMADGTYGNDTWTYQNGSWTQLTPTISPPVRRSAAMAWDPVDRYVVLFGGLYLQDTWTFLGGVWTNRTALVVDSINTPSARWNSQMAFDAGDGYMLLFSGCYALACAASTQDSWSYLNGSWSNITATAGTPPPERGTAMMLWYPPDNAVLLFGGSRPSQTYYNDTWEFSGGSWRPLQVPVSPWPRGDSFSTYVPALGYVLLFGGLTTPSVATYSQPYTLNDTWAFSNDNWENLSGSIPIAPAPRWGLHGAGTYDAHDGYALLFGGADATDSTLYGDTWTYGPGPGAPGGNGSGGGGNGSGSNNSSNNSNGSGGGGPNGSGGHHPLQGFVDQGAAAGGAPWSVQFVATTAGGIAPYHYLWNFGDGQAGLDAPTVVHTYVDPGSYRPVVTISDGDGSRVSLVLSLVVVSSHPGTTGPGIGLQLSPTATWFGGLLLVALLAIAGTVFLISKRRALARLREEGEELLIEDRTSD
jgi:hypothetical protein